MDLLGIGNTDSVEEDKTIPNHQVKLWAGLVYNSITFSQAVFYLIRQNKSKIIPRRLFKCIEPLKFAIEYLETKASAADEEEEGVEGEEEVAEEAAAEEEPQEAVEDIGAILEKIFKRIRRSQKSCFCSMNSCGATCARQPVADTPEVPLKEWTEPPGTAIVQTFVTITLPQHEARTFVITPYNIVGPLFCFAKVEDGYYEIQSTLDDRTGPAEGIYVLKADGEEVGIFYLLLYRYSYVVLDFETGARATLEDGDYECETLFYDIDDDSSDEEEGVEGQSELCPNINSCPALLEDCYNICDCPQKEDTYVLKENDDSDSAYFMSRAGANGMFKFFYCDRRENREPRPLADGIYPVWDVSKTGESNPSTKKDGVYLLSQCVQDLYTLLENAPKTVERKDIVTEKLLKMQANTDKSGVNITKIIRHSKQFIAPQLNYKSKVPQIKNKSKFIESSCCKCRNVPCPEIIREYVEPEPVQEEEEYGEEEQPPEEPDPCKFKFPKKPKLQPPTFECPIFPNTMCCFPTKSTTKKLYFLDSDDDLDFDCAWGSKKPKKKKKKNYDDDDNDCCHC